MVVTSAVPKLKDLETKRLFPFVLDSYLLFGKEEI